MKCGEVKVGVRHYEQKNRRGATSVDNQNTKRRCRRHRLSKSNPVDPTIICTARIDVDIHAASIDATVLIPERGYTGGKKQTASYQWQKKKKKSKYLLRHPGWVDKVGVQAIAELGNAGSDLVKVDLDEKRKSEMERLGTLFIH